MPPLLAAYDLEWLGDFFRLIKFWIKNHNQYTSLVLNRTNVVHVIKRLEQNANWNIRGDHNERLSKGMYREPARLMQ